MLSTICAKCLKPEELCICSEIQSYETKTQILILQHPQEPKHILSTAHIAHLSLKHSTLKIGLSWPNLQTALGKPAIPSEWGVLYFGSGIKEKNKQTPLLEWVSRNGNPEKPPKSINGLVVLDGTWSQAKTLWWRNPWLLKLKRAVLTPPKASLYRGLRKEPKKECLSTLESLSLMLSALGENPEIEKYLNTLLLTLLNYFTDKKSKISE